MTADNAVLAAVTTVPVTSGTQSGATLAAILKPSNAAMLR
jgi:hypothetical protein